MVAIPCRFDPDYRHQKSTCESKCFFIDILTILCYNDLGDEMENNKELPIRKKNRLQNYDYSSCGAYFITICTQKKQNYFWKNVGATIGRPQDVELSFYGEIVSDAIKSISSTYPALLVERYVIMPNHIHLLLRVCSDE